MGDKRTPKDVCGEAILMPVSTECAAALLLLDTLVKNPNMIPRLSGYFSLFGLQNHAVLSLQPRGERRGGGGTPDFK